MTWNVFSPPSFEDDPNYQRERAKLAELVGRLNPRHSKLILDQAQLKYAETVRVRERLEDKLGELLRTAGLIATVLAPAAQLLKVEINGWLRAAFACLLGAIVCCVIARRSFFRPSPASVRRLLEDVETVPDDAAHGEAWMAAVVHDVYYATRTLNNWLARWLNAASWLVAIAVAFLFPALLD